MKLAGSLAVAAITLLLSGCGDADPFTGSWKATDKKGDTPDFVIAKTDGAYQVAFVGVGGWAPLTKRSGKLRYDWRSPSPPHEKRWMTFTHDSGRLLVREKGLSAFECTKVSDRTTAPSPKK